MNPRIYVTRGRRFVKPDGSWIEVAWNAGGRVSWNQSGATFWSGGRLQCSRAKFLEILKRGGYL